MVAGITVFLFAQAVTAPSPGTQPVAPMPDNKPCAYPEPARQALVSGWVTYRAQVTPIGAVEAVNVLAVPLAELGFEEAVRACVGEWRFEPAPTGATESRIHVGRLRFSLLPDEEAAVGSRLTELAALWNKGDKRALEELEAGRNDIPGASHGRPFLARRIGRAKGDKCRMELDPGLGYMRFLARELVQAKQSFACLLPQATSEVPESVTLELALFKSQRGWRFVDLENADVVWGLVWHTTARAGREVPEPKLVRQVPPVYPPIAREARIGGVVILECLVSGEGKVVGSRVLRGIPLLDQALIDAVREWLYEPTSVNGEASPVIVTVEYQFRLP